MIHLLILVSLTLGQSKALYNTCDTINLQQQYNILYDNSHSPTQIDRPVAAELSYKAV